MERRSSDGVGDLGKWLVETGERLELRPGKRAVTQCRIDHAFTIIFGDADETFEIRIDEPFTLGTAGGDDVSLDPEGPSAAIAPALDVLHRGVESAVAFKDGRLEIGFDDGRVLRVPAGETYEAWTLVGPAGLYIVSVPGGELAIWEPKREDPARS